MLRLPSIGICVVSYPDGKIGVFPSGYETSICVERIWLQSIGVCMGCYGTEQ